MKNKQFYDNVRNRLSMMLIVLGSLLLFQSGIASTGSHGVMIKGLNYDAGFVQPGKTIVHTLTIVNLSIHPE
jgi:high-affinity nickel permease